jgi:hypothetical protein
MNDWQASDARTELEDLGCHVTIVNPQPSREYFFNRECWDNLNYPSV